MKKEINAIEEAIQNGDTAIDFYLDEVTKSQFIADVKDLKARYSDTQAIKNAISALSELLTKENE
jgi:hypothetical protein